MAPPPTTDSPSRAALLDAHVSSFLSALTPPDPSELEPSPPPSPSSLLSAYFASSSPTIHEHGPPFTQKLLPFLGRPFTGNKACVRYFELMGAALELEIQRSSVRVSVDANFPDSSSDSDANKGEDGDGNGNAWRKCAGRVLATGQCHCVSRATGRGGHEEVVWIFSGFQESQDGKEVRFARWDIWADPASAWVAEGGGDADSVGWGRGKERE